MSAGPATKMYDYVKRWADRGFVEARERIEDLPPATLEAMDTAAEIMRTMDAEASHNVVADSDLRLALECPFEGGEEALLRVLLDRAIQRRKEPGNGHA